MPKLYGGEAAVHIAPSRLSYWLSPWWLLPITSVYYLFLISNGSFQILAPEVLDAVFNSMLTHLLNGRFDVDSSAIGFEAYIIGGKTYTYFGIFPALLRLVLVPIGKLGSVSIARLSCLAADIIYIVLQIRMFLLVHRSLPPSAQHRVLGTVMIATTLLSGPQLYILASAQVYHEPILWAAAMAAAFNLIVVRAAFAGRGLSGTDLAWLCVLAGLALNTRASVGVALYVGAGLLIAWAAISEAPGHSNRQTVPFDGPAISKVVASTARNWTLWQAFAILALFLVMAGVVNFERFGSPLTFADARTYPWGVRFNPEYFQILNHYGVLGITRLWFGALYYATGLPYLVKKVALFHEYLQTVYYNIEPPLLIPGVLTNPLTDVLAFTGLSGLILNRRNLPTSVAPILCLALIGNAVAVLIVCAFWSLSVRYRFDLAPFFTLAALIGYRFVALGLARGGAVWVRRLSVVAIGLCLIGVVSSHYQLILYKVCTFSVPRDVKYSLRPLVPWAGDWAFEMTVPKLLYPPRVR